MKSIHHQSNISQIMVTEHMRGAKNKYSSRSATLQIFTKERTALQF